MDPDVIDTKKWHTREILIMVIDSYNGYNNKLYGAIIWLTYNLKPTPNSQNFCSSFFVTGTLSSFLFLKSDSRPCCVQVHFSIKRSTEDCKHGKQKKNVVNV